MNLRALWNKFAQPATRPDRPLPSSVASGRGANLVLDWLDAAGLPWRATRGELAARYGVHADNPYEWDLVSLEVNPAPLPGMLWPFGFQASACCSPAPQPVTFSTHVSVGEYRGRGRAIGTPSGRQRACPIRLNRLIEKKSRRIKPLSMVSSRKRERLSRTML